ncbi:ribbon-helix-helix domain-containing protein [Novosphingopyxis sp. YJ-S2-01]|uniref:ribbon-helix-helix domain-containing protein n=1 Tax=Novosphingopyxis sp. YJ-S2-01 TaxID=2794021 RepID=UPI0018DD7AEA|nr:ribbon-helix-helix domain-containing protein [Novosphingopyxis sp. YJ-S2-01]MBH9536480.1 ribbon-helix-helix protein, CopG family [Novosphingopyxis sp. YJ-S2-01]
MTRILADLPDEDIKWLDALAAEQGKSRASILREAVSAYRAEAPKDWLDIGFGAWARDGVTIDPHEYDRQRRAEWTRPWDDDYDEVRVESPEYFTEEDDRERAHYVALTRKTAADTQSDPE